MLRCDVMMGVNGVLCVRITDEQEVAGHKGGGELV